MPERDQRAMHSTLQLLARCPALLSDESDCLRLQTQVSKQERSSRLAILRTRTMDNLYEAGSPRQNFATQSVTVDSGGRESHHTTPHHATPHHIALGLNCSSRITQAHDVYGITQWLLHEVECIRGQPNNDDGHVHGPLQAVNPNTLAHELHKSMRFQRRKTPPLARGTVA